MRVLGVFFTFAAVCQSRAVSSKLHRTMSSLSLHDFKANLLNGEELSLSQFAGKPVLIENIASL
jgi:hypothetical protein